MIQSIVFGLCSGFLFKPVGSYNHKRDKDVIARAQVYCAETFNTCVKSVEYRGDRSYWVICK